MRVLCLRFCVEVSSSWADVFLRWSPQIVVRPPFFLFVEVSTTSRLFGGEELLLNKAIELAESLSKAPVRGAIADSAPVAQVLSLHEGEDGGGVISPEGQANVDLAGEPLSSLMELEGLVPWPDPEQVARIAEFFASLGLRRLGDLHTLAATSFRERWGETGRVLWKRLQGRDHQVLSPHLAPEPFYSYLYFEHALSTLSFLEHQLQAPLDEVFMRLAGRGRFAKGMTILFHGEYSKLRHEVRIEPVTPSREKSLFLDLLLKRCEHMDFANPIKEIEILIDDVAEKDQQLDFFEPRDHSRERWRRLMSFAALAGVKMGFLERRAGLFPEERVRMVEAGVNHFEARDRIESSGEAVQLKPAYSKDFFKAPRPSLLLREPKPLGDFELERWTRMTKAPVERWVGSWWESEGMPGRDYFYAVSPQGELAWLYRDRESGRYYLHGVFD